MNIYNVWIIANYQGLMELWVWLILYRDRYLQRFKQLAGKVHKGTVDIQISKGLTQSVVDKYVARKRPCVQSKTIVDQTFNKPNRNSCLFIKYLFKSSLNIFKPVSFCFLINKKWTLQFSADEKTVFMLIRIFSDPVLLKCTRQTRRLKFTRRSTHQFPTLTN